MHFLDNDAARSACIRADASTSIGQKIVETYVDLEYKCRFSPWFARVASHSNPADDPVSNDLLFPLAFECKQSRTGLASALESMGDLRVH